MKTIRVSEQALERLIDSLLEEYGTHQRLKVSDADSYQYYQQKCYDTSEQIKSLFTDLLRES